MTMQIRYFITCIYVTLFVLLVMLKLVSTAILCRNIKSPGVVINARA